MNATQRRAAAGIPFGLGVTPDSTKPEGWRRTVGWAYPAAVVEESEPTPAGGGSGRVPFTGKGFFEPTDRAPDIAPVEQVDAREDRKPTSGSLTDAARLAAQESVQTAIAESKERLSARHATNEAARLLAYLESEQERVSAQIALAEDEQDIEIALALLYSRLDLAAVIGVMILK